MELDEWIYNYNNNNTNGAYSKETSLKKNYNDIYNLINKYIEDNKINKDIPFKEKCYLFVNKINKIPVCKNCNSDVKFIGIKLGYHSSCSCKCSTILNNHKITESIKNKYGVDHPSKIPHVIANRKEQRIDKIKTEIHPAELLSYVDDHIKIKCDICNKIHETHYNIYAQRVQLDLDWRNCITGYMNGKSNGEIELIEYIKSVYTGPIDIRDRKILNGKELDVYLPDLKLAIEYNGLYWHSELHKDKKYHHDKWKLCNDKDITLIQIYEDEWIYKQEIIKSRLNSILNKVTKIYARKCKIKEITYKETKIFLEENHLQGSVNSSINIGLYYLDKLVSIMTFGKPRKGLKYKTDKDEVYELYRFCNSLNISVIGGASRLFKYFINNYKPNEVFSYSALEWPGKVYEKIGLELINISDHSYWYIIGRKRISRHVYNKQNLVKMGYDKNRTANDILKELKIYKIYGPGNKRFIWTK